jgi:TolB-like protein
MKKTFFLIGLLAVITTALFAQNTALPRLAVVEFTKNVSNERINADAITVRNLVESQMVGTRKYEIITRDDIDKLLENQRIQVSSISSAENLKKLELQNISYIVTGSLDAMGNDYAITVRVLDVSNGRFSHSDNDFMGSGSRELYNGINSLITKFVAGMSSDGSKVGQIAYKTGDTGPAGGIIFYDKGFVSDGWRYLEAAPVGAEFYLEKRYSHQTDLSGNGRMVGTGKLNTQNIVDRLKRFGGNDRAAQICTDMDINGFTDWFLPSIDELRLMYDNLYKKGIGSFRDACYRSSSRSSDDESIYFFFDKGRTDYYNRHLYYAYFVRAVRAF